MQSEKRCQCASNATHHAVNACQRTATVQVVREDQLIFVCEDCASSTDKVIARRFVREIIYWSQADY